MYMLIIVPHLLIALHSIEREKTVGLRYQVRTRLRP